MPYMALEKRTAKGFDPELESVEERISVDGKNIEIYGWVDDHRRIAVILSIDEIPEELIEEDWRSFELQNGDSHQWLPTNFLPLALCRKFHYYTGRDGGGLRRG